MLNVSLKTKMALAGAVLFIVFSAAIAYFSISYFENKFKQSLANQQYALACAIADNIDDKLIMLRNALVAASQQLPSGIITDTDKAQRFLDERVTLHSLFDTTIFLVHTDGTIIAESPVLPERRAFDLSHREYFQKTVATGKPVISSPYISSLPDHRPVVMLTAPVFDGRGKLICILCGGMRLLGNNLLGDVASMKIGTTGYAYLAATDRTMIVHPDKTRIMKIAAAPGENKMFDRAIAGFDGSGVTVNSRGVPLLSSFRHLSATNWILALNFPTSEAYAPMYKTRQYLLGGIAAGTLAMLVIAWLVMKRLTAPLAAVTRQVETMEGLNRLDYRSLDEIGTLVAAFNRMVTAQERQQEALRESHALLQNTFASLNEAVFIVETGTRKILDYNDAVKDMFGYARGELIGTNTSCLHIDEEMSRRFGDAMLKAYEDHGFFETTYRMKRRNGAVFDSEHFVTPIYDDNNRITSHVCVVRDISERMRAEERLRESEEEFRNLVESTSDWVWKVDERGVCTYTSPRVHDMLGYTPEEVVGKMPFDFMPPEEARRVGEIFRSIADSRENITCLENVNLHKDGRRVVLETSGRPFFDGAGNLRGYRGINRDITERKDIEEQIMRLASDLQRRAADLATANRELETFSYTLSHDLKAPLAGIFISVEALIDDYAGQLDETGRFFVESIQKASGRMEELLEAMLLLARVARSEMQCEEVNLSGLAQEILLQLRMEHPERTVDWVIAPDLSATGDPRLLRSALENLLGNAWKYTQHNDGAHIEFGMTEREGETVYYVRDDGAGFPMEKAPQLFQPFQRLHRNGEFEGTGVGLATVQRIIQRHGGRIWGEGEVGKGATFYFTLGEPGAE